MKYKIKYFYLATGMEGIPDELPEMIIDADNWDRAIYYYWCRNNHPIAVNKHFDDEYMMLERHIREWGISCTPLSTLKEISNMLMEVFYNTPKDNSRNIKLEVTREQYEYFHKLLREEAKKFTQVEEPRDPSLPPIEFSTIKTAGGLEISFIPLPDGEPTSVKYNRATSSWSFDIIDFGPHGKSNINLKLESDEEE